jgi:hypothetical protein
LCSLCSGIAKEKGEQKGTHEQKEKEREREEEKKGAIV